MKRTIKEAIENFTTAKKRKAGEIIVAMDKLNKTMDVHKNCLYEFRSNPREPSPAAIPDFEAQSKNIINKMDELVQMGNRVALLQEFKVE